MTEVTVSDTEEELSEADVARALGQAEGGAEVHAERAEAAAGAAGEAAEGAGEVVAVGAEVSTQAAERAEAAAVLAESAASSIGESLNNHTIALQSLVEELRAAKEQPASTPPPPEKPAAKPPADRAPTTKPRFRDRYNRK